jgi:hypothetical protein
MLDSVISYRSKAAVGNCQVIYGGLNFVEKHKWTIPYPTKTENRAVTQGIGPIRPIKKGPEAGVRKESTGQVVRKTSQHLRWHSPERRRYLMSRLLESWESENERVYIDILEGPRI